MMVTENNSVMDEYKVYESPRVIGLSIDGVYVKTIIRRGCGDDKPYHSGSCLRAVVQQLGAQITNLTGLDPSSTDERLYLLCKALGDNILDPAIKAELSLTMADIIYIEADEELIHIPWELAIYEGVPLWRRFHLGRILTGSDCSIFAGDIIRSQPLKVWFLTDNQPRIASDVSDRGLLDDIVSGMEKSSLQVMVSAINDITDDQFKAECCNYDIIHYHADMPDSAEGIDHERRLAELAAVYKEVSGAPFLFFYLSSKAHLSGKLIQLLKAGGVRHCISLCSTVSIEVMHDFVGKFYQSLADSKSIGASITEAQAQVSAVAASTSQGLPCFLYGNPKQAIIHQRVPAVEVKPLLVSDSTEKKAGYHDERDPDVMFQQLLISSPRTSKTVYRGLGALIGLGLALVVILFFYLMFKPQPLLPPEAVVKVPKGYQEQAVLKEQKINSLLAELKYNIEHQFGNIWSPEDISQPKPLLLSVDIESRRLNPVRNTDMLVGGIIELEFRLNSFVSVQPRINMESMFNRIERRVSGGLNQQQLRSLADMRLIAFVEVGDSGNQQGVFIQLADITKGAVIASVSAPMMNDASIINVKDMMMNSLHSAINRLYPLKGIVMERGGEGWRLNIGQLHGVRLGQKFTDASYKSTYRVSSLEEDQCLIILVAGEDTVFPGESLVLSGQ